MIVRNFLNFSLNKEKMRKIGIIINRIHQVRRKVKFGKHLLLQNQLKKTMNLLSIQNGMTY